MARPTAHSALRTPHLKRLVALLLDWFVLNARDLPWRRTRDPYAIWVSEIMLQQTQVKTVIPFWTRWMRELPTIEAVAKASPAKIHKLWEGLGYYTRVRNLQKAAKQIVECGLRSAECEHVKFPDTFEEVLALPGIGRYTAGAICSIAFNQPTPILDGNVIRVLTRIFGITENPKQKQTSAQLWELATELVVHAPRITDHAADSRTRGRRKDDEDRCSHLNQSLMELGALICTPRNPQCGICPVNKLCVAFKAGRVGELPNILARTKAAARHFAAFVVERDGRFLVRQRPAGVVNAHLWEFPNVEVGARVSRSAACQNPAGRGHLSNDIRQSQVLRLGEPRSESIADTATQILGFTAATIQPICTIKHSITRYRITLEAFRAGIGRTSSTSPHLIKTMSGTRGARPSEKAGIWKSPAQMRRLAFTAAHKKLLACLNV